MKIYYAQVAISASDDVDPEDVFDYVDNAVRSWGELMLISDPPIELQSGPSNASVFGTSGHGDGASEHEHAACGL